MVVAAPTAGARPASASSRPESRTTARSVYAGSSRRPSSEAVEQLGDTIALCSVDGAMQDWASAGSASRELASQAAPSAPANAAKAVAPSPPAGAVAAAAGPALPPRATPKPLPGEPLVLRCEEKAEEWHFDEAAFAAKLEKLRAETDSFRAQEAAARARAQSVKEQAERHVSDTLSSAHEGDLKWGAGASRMRSEIMEQETATEALLEATQEKLAEIGRQTQAERKSRRELEAKLKEERQQAEVAKRRLAELEDEERSAMAAIAERMRARRTETQEEIAEVQRSTEEAIRLLEAQLRRDIKAVRVEIDQARLEGRGAMDVHIHDRYDNLDSADVHVASRVDRQVREDLAHTHSQVKDTRDETIQMVKEVQVRDFALEALMRSTIDDATNQLGCAEHEARQAATYDMHSKQKARLATKVLGDIFPRSTQFAHKMQVYSRPNALAASGLNMVATPRAPAGLTPCDSPQRFLTAGLAVG